MQKLIICFLASHGGSNMQSIINACKSGKLQAKPGVLISNNSESGAIERAKNEGIPFYHISSKTHPEPIVHDEAIIKVLRENSVNLICLAGYMRKLGTKVLDEYKGRILNIHPALLPKFGGEGMWGMHVHAAVLASGEKITGCTVHLVDEDYDNGRILAQSKVKVFENDTIETLAERVLIKEHELYPTILQKIAEGIIRL